MDTSSLPTSPVNQRNCHSNTSTGKKKRSNKDGVETNVENQIDNKNTDTTQDLSDDERDKDQKRTQDLETSSNLSDQQPPKREQTSSFQDEVI